MTGEALDSSPKCDWVSESLDVLRGDVPRIEAHTQHEARNGAVVKTIVDGGTSRISYF